MLGLCSFIREMPKGKVPEHVYAGIVRDTIIGISAIIVQPARPCGPALPEYHARHACRRDEMKTIAGPGYIAAWILDISAGRRSRFDATVFAAGAAWFCNSWSIVTSA
jgi:hypothetical protein